MEGMTNTSRLSLLRCGERFRFKNMRSLRVYQKESGPGKLIFRDLKTNLVSEVETDFTVVILGNSSEMARSRFSMPIRGKKNDRTHEAN